MATKAKKPAAKKTVAKTVIKSKGKPKTKPKTKAKTTKAKIKSASKPKTASSTKYSNPTMFGDHPGARDYYAPENPPISFLPPEVEPTGRTLFNSRDFDFFLRYSRPIPPPSRVVVDHPWPIPISWLMKLFKKK